MLSEEWHILGDLNINLHQNVSTLGQENKSIIKDANKISSETNKYLEFYKTFGLKQLIKSPTRVTPNTSTLIDHILTNTNEKITQCGLTNTGLSDHQTIFCRRKIKKEKVGDHKQISFKFLKTYSVDEYEKARDKVTFPNYEKYHNIKKAYNDFFQKLIEVVNNIAPLKTARIKNTSNEWFDREIAEKLSIRDKLFKKFKSSRLNIDWEIYKEARNEVQKTIKQKKKQYLEEKLSENIAKPKELWQTLKSLGLPNKKNSPSNICLKNKNGLLFDSLSIAETFKKYYSSLAENLALRLPKPTNNFGI